MGLTVLDAGVLIGFLDAGDAHHHATIGELAAARARGDRLVLPASAYAETLVGPARRGDDAIAAVDAFLDHTPIILAPLDGETARTAARLRAGHGRLKLPDALVVATAIVVEADVLVTTDRGWPARRALGLAARLVTLPSA